MFLNLRFCIGTERDDLAALGAGIVDGTFDERLPYPTPAKFFWNAGMINNDNTFACTRISHFGHVAVHGNGVTTAAIGFAAMDFKCAQRGLQYQIVSIAVWYYE